MKLQTASHSEPAMRFFTPELFVRFNSTNDEEADEANEEWETALTEYQKHLNHIRDHMPTPVRKLVGLCFHDVELLACDQAAEALYTNPSEPSPSFWNAIAILSVKNRDNIASMIYFLWDRIREFPAPANWSFSKKHIHWLYDEVDLAPGDQNKFLHRVLLSDGRVLAIPLLSVFIHNLPNTQQSERGRGFSIVESDAAPDRECIS